MKKNCLLLFLLCCIPFLLNAQAGKPNKLKPSNGEGYSIPLNAPSDDCEPVTAFPFEEGFEELEFPANCWKVYDIDGGVPAWVRLSHAYSGSYSVCHNYSDSDQDGWLVSPQMAFGNGSYTLSFFSKNNYPDDYAKNSVWVSTGSGDPADGDFVEIWSPASVEEDWVEIELSLASYSNQEVYIAFRYQGEDAHGWYVDDVKIVEEAGSDPVSELTGGNAWNAGAIDIDVTTTSGNFVLKNTGAGTLTVSDVTTLSAPWSTTFNSALALAGGEEHTFTFSITPTTVDTFSSSFSFTTSDGETYTITLSAFVDDCTPISTFPFEEGFEGSEFPANCWKVYDMDGIGYTWNSITAAAYVYSGSASAYHRYSNGDQDGWLVSPPIAFGGESYTLSFYSSNNYPEDYEKNSVWVSTGSGNPADGDFVEVWSPASVGEDWVKTELPLASYSNQKVYIAFRYEGNNAHEWYLDDVKIVEISGGDPISELTGGNAWDAGIVDMNATTTSSNFVLRNAGAGTLTVSDASTLGAPWSTTFDSDIELGFGEEHTFTFSITPTTVDTFSSSFSFTTSDGEAYTISLDALAEDCGTPITTFPFEEGFEDVAFPANCWKIYDIDGKGSTWTRTSYSHSGSASAYHNYSGSGDQDGWLVSPLIGFGESSYALSFYSSNNYPGDYGKNSVWISTGSGNPADGEFVEIWSPEAVGENWVETEFPLTSYASQEVYIAFRYQGLSAHGWYLDDVKIVEVLDKDLAVTGITPNYVIEEKTVTPKVAVANLGADTATEWTLTLSDGGSYSSTKTGASMDFREEAVIVMDDWTPTAASTLTATITYANDENPSNNTISVTVDYGAYSEEAYATGVKTPKGFVSVDLATGEVALVGEIGSEEFPVGEDYDGEYIYRAFNDKTVAAVMPDGGINILGSIRGLSSGHSIVGMCYDWGAECWYLNTVNDTEEAYLPELYKLDMTTLGVTAVGSSGLEDHFLRGADMADDGYVYSVSMTTSELVRVNPKTGEYIAVGATGLSLAYAQDISFDEKTKQLYTIAFHDDDYEQYAAFGTYNLETGAFTEIHRYGSTQFATMVIINLPGSDVAIEDVTASVGNGSKVYPNPSTDGRVNVSVAEKATVRVFDFSGKLIQVKPVDANSISTINLNSGIYLIQVDGVDNKASHKVIVK